MKLTSYFQLIFVVKKDHEKCRTQLVVIVIFCKLMKNGKRNDDAVYKLCSQSRQSVDYYTVKLF